MEMNGLFTVGALFPEFANGTSWRRFAAETLHEGAQQDFLPDGMWNELTTGYMQVTENNPT
jgi:Heparinase II/III N-terminus